jgi:hypothetical protein
MAGFQINNYKIPNNIKSTVSENLANEIKGQFVKDRENRFQLFLLSSGIRQKYLDKKTNKYTDEFHKWYTTYGLSDFFGSTSNFTKYAGCGEVVNYVANKTSDPEKYLKQLPISVGALYEISIILKMSEEIFATCLQFTVTRKTLTEEKHDWKTVKPPLINSQATELKVRTWRRKWDNPPPAKQKRTDKRTMPFITIKCSGELYDFDKKTGDKTGCLDLVDVENFLKVIQKHFDDSNMTQFKVEDNLDLLTEGYIKRRDANDPAKKILKKKSVKKTVKTKSVKT